MNTYLNKANNFKRELIEVIEAFALTPDPLSNNIPALNAALEEEYHGLEDGLFYFYTPHHIEISSTHSNDVRVFMTINSVGEEKDYSLEELEIDILTLLADLATNIEAIKKD